jgi:ABC-type sulfate transport system substrate-binding protein
MKTLVNYVVQDAKEHKHESEILEITSPPYTFSPEPPVCEVMKWAERKQKELLAEQKLIIMSMFKI